MFIFEGSEMSHILLLEMGNFFACFFRESDICHQSSFHPSKHVNQSHNNNNNIKCIESLLKTTQCWMWWFTPVILAIWEAEIGKVKIPGQPRQIVFEIPIFKIIREK
jgi:hypothetical protein